MPISRVQPAFSTPPQASQARSLSRFLIADVTAPSESGGSSLEDRFVQERDKAQTIEQLETLLAEKSPFATIAEGDYQLHLKLGEAWIEKIKSGDTSEGAAKKAYKFVYRANSIAEAGDNEQRTKEVQALVARLPNLKESDSDKAATEMPPPKKDLNQLRDEALHYADRGEKGNNPGLKMMALKKLKAIAQTKWGEQDWKTQYHFAKLAYEHQYIEEAFPAARRAVELANAEKEKGKSKALLDGELNKRYGSVKLCRSPASELMAGYIRPIPGTPLINQDKKAIFADVVARLKKREVTLPSYEDCTTGKAQALTLYLPGGRFYVGTQEPIEIKVGEELPAQKVILQGAEVDNAGTYAGIALVAGILAVIGIGIASGLNGEEQGVKLVK